MKTNNMAKKTEELVEKKQTFEQKAKELEKRFSSTNKDRIVIPTGSVAYDNALGGGYVTGRVFEKIAWEGAGKTTLALHAIAEAQKLGLNAAYIDAEHALDEKYARRIGVDWGKMPLFQPPCGEDGFDYAKEMIKTGELSLLVIDSISGMLPKKQMEDPAGTSHLGLHARLIGQQIPTVVNLADIHNCCVICISQFREKIGVMFGSPETTQGGNALKFWASVRTEFRKSLDKEGDIVQGIIAKFKVIKNKIVSPYKTGTIPIIFGQGIDKLEEIKDLGKEYGLIRERAGIITNIEYNTKWTLKEFSAALKEPSTDSCISLYESMKISIINKLNNTLQDAN